MIILVPMAGLATRFVHEGILTPKPLIETNGMTLIEHAISTLGVKGKHIFITRVYANLEDNKRLSVILKRLSPDCIELCLDRPTHGAVETCLKASNHI